MTGLHVMLWAVLTLVFATIGTLLWWPLLLQVWSYWHG